MTYLDKHIWTNHRRATAAVTLAAGIIVLGAAANVAATADDSPNDSSAPALRAGEQQPIVVADAYHGIGVIVCHDNRRLVEVADAYHGVGIAVCIDP